MKLPEEIKTEKMAIKQSILMWHWLWKHPTKNKNHYFVATNFDIEQWDHGCACCEYFTRKVGTCSNCILDETGHCTPANDDSYSKWYSGINKKGNSYKIYIALTNYWEEKGWKDKAVEEVLP